MNFKDIKRNLAVQKIDGSTNTTTFWKFFVNELLPDIETQPKYQRDIVWSKKQQKEYIEHILSGGINGKQFIIARYSEQDEDKTMVVIDGQQRIMAIKNS